MLPPAGTHAGAASTTGSRSPRLRVGVAGLGRAFTLMLPGFVADPRLQLVAACVNDLGLYRDAAWAEAVLTAR